MSRSQHQSSSDWHVSQHLERVSGPNSSNNILGHSSLLSSDSCICFMHSPLWWTDRLVKREMTALIYNLSGEDWCRYLNPISVTTSPSCTLTGCSPPLPTADGYHVSRACRQVLDMCNNSYDGYLLRKDAVFTISTFFYLVILTHIAFISNDLF